MPLLLPLIQVIIRICVEIMKDILILTHVVFCVTGPESVDHFTLFCLLSQRSGEAGEGASWKLEHGILSHRTYIIIPMQLLLSVEKGRKEAYIGKGKFELENVVHI